jgi:hypothetical protein
MKGSIEEICVSSKRSPLIAGRSDGLSFGVNVCRVDRHRSVSVDCFLSPLADFLLLRERSMHVS